jgi:anthranilate phosphoribosyltransferase
VLLHGWNSDQQAAAAVRDALPKLGIEIAKDQTHAATLLARDGIAYLPLETLSPTLFRLLRLRTVFGLRSCINTVLRVLNPGQAPAAVQGVFHPPYREIQMDAGTLLGQPNLTILKGGGGEFERHPTKDVALYGLRHGQKWETTAPALIDEVRRLAEAPNTPTALLDLWEGRMSDPFATAIVLGTAALALDTLGVVDSAKLAYDLWHNRPLTVAA